MNVFALLNIFRRLSNLEKEFIKLNQATSDLQGGQAKNDAAVAALVKASQDAAAAIAALAGQIAANNGVSAADAEAVAADLNAKADAMNSAAAALEAAIPAPPAPETPSTPAS